LEPATVSSAVSAEEKVVAPVFVQDVVLMPLSVMDRYL
jgi:hypothetical protein